MPMRVTHSKNAASSKSYFELSDYLDSDPKELLKGQWFGKAAKLLGLEGEVDKAAFDRLVDNQHPFEDRQLTPRQRADRRVGTDLTFSSPKSVSVLWAYTQDDRILQAVQQAASETVAEIEREAQTRVNPERGVMTLAKTANLVGASWLHTTSRPVDGYPDPQLHVHNFVLNMTHTGDRWTALDLSAVVRDSGLYETSFQARLAENLQQLGYAVERNQRDFEITGIDRETINKFSRRTQQIEKAAEELGIEDASAKGKLGASTRDRKSAATIPAETLPAHWRSLFSTQEAVRLGKIAEAEYQAVKEEHAAQQAVNRAMEHCFERDSVIRERQLMRTALQHGIGTSSVDDIHKALENAPLIRINTGNDTLVTTRDRLLEERAILQFAKRGKGEFAALAPSHPFSRDWLSQEQRNAVRGLLDSYDQVNILRGVAGSGKTTLMQETIEAIEAGGHSVTVLAPSADAAHGVLRDKEGFNAETLARFLVDDKMQSAAKGQVIWVDEGALVGTRDLYRLTQLADHLDARLILSGDVKQHQPVSAGLPFKLLEEQAGIKPFEIKTIRRQKTEAYREAVTLLSQGDATGGLNKLDDLGFIAEIEDDGQRYLQLARDYADAMESGESTLVISPTHAERAIVVDAIRDELKQRGTISNEERQYETLQSKRLTAAERRDSIHYEPGDVVEFITRGRGGFKSGDRITVSAVEHGTVFAQHHGKQIEVPVDSPKSFDVYRPVTREFAKGDMLRITKNRKANQQTGEKRLNNGMLVTLKGFTRSGDLKLSNGQTLSKGWKHLDYGTVVTSHASQGKTYDRTLVAQSSLSLPASSPEQLYVSASRARNSTTLYTDSKTELFATAMNQKPSLNASDIAATRVKQKATGPKRSLAMQAERIRIEAARAKLREQQQAQVRTSQNLAMEQST